jgi:hypothetical protein
MSGAALRIVLLSAGLPLAEGPEQRALAHLADHLARCGHRVEALPLPATNRLADRPGQMAAFRMLELDQHYDGLVTLGPPAHAARHRRKTCWLLNPAPESEAPECGSEAAAAAARGLRAALDRADARAFGEATRLFAGSDAAEAALRRLGLSPLRLDVPAEDDAAGWHRAAETLLA